jgi:hypothetical protein
MKQLTAQSTERLLRRTALIQQHTGALTRDAAALSAFIATGGNADYSRAFGVGAAALAEKGHTPDQLAQKLETRIRARDTQGLQRDRTQGRPDITLDRDRDMPR